MDLEAILVKRGQYDLKTGPIRVTSFSGPILHGIGPVFQSRDPYWPCFYNNTLNARSCVSLQKVFPLKITGILMDSFETPDS